LIKKSSARQDFGGIGLPLFRRRVKGRKKRETADALMIKGKRERMRNREGLASCGKREECGSAKKLRL